MMKEILSIIMAVVIFGMIVLLCLFSCIASSKADEYWEQRRKELEKNDRRRL